MIAYRCDLCGEVRECSQREIEQTEYVVTSTMIVVRGADHLRATPRDWRFWYIVSQVFECQKGMRLKWTDGPSARW
jgi:hypothetical protein